MKKNQIFSSYLSAGKMCGKKCGRNVAFSPRIGHFGRESATVDKKEREPEFELRFPEFRQKNGRDREI